MDIEEIIKRVQRKLGVEDDGKAGPITWKAIYEKVVGTDSRPAPNIADVPAVQSTVTGPTSTSTSAST